MGWHIFEKLLEKTANYSPFVGKLWIVFIFIFRLIIVTSIGDTIYEDEQAEFECNTNDPGCKQFCFTKFTPVSQIRFFAVQLLLIGTPSMLFIVYTMHKITSLPAQPTTDDGKEQPKQEDNAREAYRIRKRSRRKRRRRRRQKLRYMREYLMANPGELPRYKDVVVHHPETKDELITKRVHLENGKLITSKEGIISSDTTTSDSSLSSSDEENFEKPTTSSNKAATEAMEKNTEKKQKVKTKTVYNPDGNDEIYETRAIVRAYFIHAVARFLVELGFLYLQYIMYGFNVNWFFDCTGEPCTKEIRCYVSRPKEKTYLLIFMYVMAGLATLLNLVEIILIIYEHMRKKSGKKEGKGRMTSMPLTQIISTNNGRYPGDYQQQALHLNTFPDLGPYPLRRDNRVGGSSCHVIQSDNGAYHY